MRTTPELNPPKLLDLAEISPAIGRTVFEAIATATPEVQSLDQEEDNYYRGVTRLPDGQTVPDN